MFDTQARLRCDRGQPCDTCLRRGLSLSCTYPTPNATGRSGTNQTRASASSNVQDRVEQLESLVVSMMSKVGAGKPNDNVPVAKLEAQSILPLNSESESIENLLPQYSSSIPDSGRISLESAETSYVDSAHWAAILDGVSIFLSFNNKRGLSCQMLTGGTIDCGAQRLLSG